tara:strand:+ start:304 stop:447 length:144 start_codon:yes stop_codon:yes gene_type:complete
MENVIFRAIGAVMVSVSISVSLDFSVFASGALASGLYFLFSTTGDSK